MLFPLSTLAGDVLGILYLMILLGVIIFTIIAVVGHVRIEAVANWNECANFFERLEDDFKQIVRGVADAVGGYLKLCLEYFKRAKRPVKPIKTQPR